MKIMKYFKEVVLKYFKTFQNFHEIFKYFEVKYFILVSPVHQAPFLLFIVHP